MSDIRKRVITGIVASFGLYLTIEIFSLSIAVITTSLLIGGNEYYEIFKQAFKKNLPEEIVPAFKGMPFPVWIVPIGFFITTFTSWNLWSIHISLLSSFIASVIYRLFQYSEFCKSSKSQDPIKKYSFAVLAAMMSDMFFTLFIGFPFSFAILMTGSQ